MRKQRIVLTALAVTAALAAVALLADGRETEKPVKERPAPRAEVASGTLEDTAPGAGGMRVYLDPETGAVLDRPTDPLTERLLDERLSTYGGDLLEEPLPGGGYRVDLRGRFQSAVVATIDPETDEVEIDCISTVATAEDRDEQ